MRLSQLFEFVVVSTAIGGTGLGVLGLIFCLFVRRDDAVNPEPELMLRVQHFRDATNLFLVSSIVQTAILLLPIFFPSPKDVPSYMAEPAIMAGVTLVVVWFWSVSLLIRAGRLGWRLGITRLRRLAICVPGIVTLVLFVLFYIKMASR